MIERRFFDSKRKVKKKEDCNHGEFDGYAFEKVDETRERYNFNNVWTLGGQILYKDGSGKIKIYYSLYYLVVNGHVLYYERKNRLFYCRSFTCSWGYFHLG